MSVAPNEKKLSWKIMAYHQDLVFSMGGQLARIFGICVSR